jgi:nicotinamide riboside transporter PnuC
MIEFIGAMTALIAFCGVWLNNRKRRACFVFFLVSNTLSLLIHLHAGFIENAQVKMVCVRDIGFIYLAVEGLWLWRKPEDNGRHAEKGE